MNITNRRGLRVMKKKERFINQRKKENYQTRMLKNRMKAVMTQLLKLLKLIRKIIIKITFKTKDLQFPIMNNNSLNSKITKINDKVNIMIRSILFNLNKEITLIKNQLLKKRIKQKLLFILKIKINTTKNKNRNNHCKSANIKNKIRNNLIIFCNNNLILIL